MKKFLVILLFPFFTLPAFAGNGSGVNGPDLKGDAIPLSIDREIELRLIESVKLRCREEFIGKLWFQVYKAVMPTDVENWESDTQENFGRLASKSGKYPGYSSTREALRGIYLSNSRIVILLKPHSIEYYTNPFSVVDDQWAQDGVILNTAELMKVPQFSYQIETVDRRYDEWGREIAKRAVVRNLQLLFGNTKAMPLLNERTGAKSALTLDFSDYRDCLLNGIQGQ